METIESPPPDALGLLRSLLGEDVVLLPIKAGEKSPRIKNWQETSVEKMSDPRYLKRLERGTSGFYWESLATVFAVLMLTMTKKLSRFLT